MSKQTGDQFYNQNQYDAAIQAYNTEIRKYANPANNINWNEIVEVLQKRGDAYAKKAQTEIVPNKQKQNAAKARDSYNIALNIGLIHKCGNTFYQECLDGIDLMDNLLWP